MFAWLKRKRKNKYHLKVIEALNKTLQRYEELIADVNSNKRYWVGYSSAWFCLLCNAVPLQGGLQDCLKCPLDKCADGNTTSNLRDALTGNNNYRIYLAARDRYTWIIGRAIQNGCIIKKTKNGIRCFQ
jgi:hypothetical protein